MATEEKTSLSVAEMRPARKLEEIAASIRARQTNIAQNIIGIGYDLIEAKAMLKHGEFSKWLADNFNMTARTARNYMSVAEKFGKTETGFRFQYTSLVELAKLPPAEIEAFIAENPSAANLSKREFKAALKKWKTDKIPVEQNLFEEATIEAEYQPVDNADTCATDLIEQLQAKIKALEEEISAKDQRLAELTEQLAQASKENAELKATASANYEPSELLTNEQAAQILGFKPATVKSLAKPSKGAKLERVYVNGRFYITRKSVEEYKATQNKKNNPGEQTLKGFSSDETPRAEETLAMAI